MGTPGERTGAMYILLLWRQIPGIAFGIGNVCHASISLKLRRYWNWAVLKMSFNRE